MRTKFKKHLKLLKMCLDKKIIKNIYGFFLDQIKSNKN